MKNTVLSLLALILFNCCHTMVERENNSEDIIIAKQVVDSFYNKVQKKDFKGAMLYFSNENLNRDSASINNYLVQTNSTKGSILKYEYTDGRSSIKIEDGNKTEKYSLLYKVTYERETRDEKIVLDNLSDNKIKIVECVFQIK